METIVSIMPFAFQDQKPGLTPGDFQMSAGSVEEPSMLVIKEAQIRMMDQNFQYFPMDVDLKLVAADVCNGYNQAQIGYDHDAMPGLFHVPGQYIDDPPIGADPSELPVKRMTAIENLKKDYMKTILEADRKQRNWFKVLVKIADDDWAVTPQHRIISDLQRMAAQYLNMERTWIDASVSDNKRCPACMSIVPSAAAICFACKAIIDKTKYDKMDFAVA